MTSSPRPTVPSERLARLRRCVNISRWFRYPSGPVPQHFLTFITDADLDLLKRLGVTGVRLTIHVDQIIPAAGAGNAPIQSTVECLKVAVQRLVNAGLAVTIAIYSAGDRVESFFRIGGFVTFWNRLASELRATDPEWVLFEPVNEPIFTVFQRQWFTAEAKLIKAIRAAAPHHTIVTSGTNWSSINGLLSHRPTSDENVIYSFHFYEPHAFTHQGAPWNSGWVLKLRGVPYPLTSQRVSSDVDPASPHFRTLLDHSTGCFDASYIDRRIRLAADWGRANRVRVWCGEFGCYPPFAPRDSVLEWFCDVRTALERHGIGWSVWSYDEELGLDRKMVDGRPVIDEGVAAALGFASRGARPLA